MAVPSMTTKYILSLVRIGYFDEVIPTARIIYYPIRVESDDGPKCRPNPSKTLGTFSFRTLKLEIDYFSPQSGNI